MTDPKKRPEDIPEIDRVIRGADGVDPQELATDACPEGGQHEWLDCNQQPTGGHPWPDTCAKCGAIKAQ